MGYYKRMMNTLLEPFKENKDIIASGDAVTTVVEPYKQYGYVAKFQTICFMGIPLIKRRNCSGATIINVRPSVIWFLNFQYLESQSSLQDMNNQFLQFFHLLLYKCKFLNCVTH